MIKPELILPAGDREKASYALAYGADALYAGLPRLSLRTKYTAFSEKSLQRAIEDTHAMGRNFYVAVNLFAHEQDLDPVKRFLDTLAPHRPDALIVSDPGIIRIIQKSGIDIPLHLSTQANTTNSESVGFWHDQGVTRVILARELSYGELERICERNEGVELEIFIHGAMCISYSGRCLLSSYLTGRDANRGECAGTCRWRYALIEESREGQRFEVEEDHRGTYILNSRDLCLLTKIPQLRALPIQGYKIEGRTKNLFYVSLTARAYRGVIDDVFDRRREEVDPQARWLIDLTDSHGFTTGFLFPEGETMQNYYEGAVRKQRIVGLVRDFGDHGLRVSVKNPLAVGDEVVGVSPNEIRSMKILRLSESGEAVSRAYGAKKQEVMVEVDTNLAEPGWRYGILVKE